ncbi:hypothetical protein DFJ63DRAFT_139205 [Scheffersomyces coipomensis]|uniref:uncharacterized protein n=1 Tax=Scheffersomyces coipomensis TaxID=1788519 RepID=UPI00315D9E4C
MKAKKSRAKNITRSRAGCVSCKKLRIRCDQTRPKCEYCVHTNRECIYETSNFVAAEYSQLSQAKLSDSELPLEIMNNSKNLVKINLNDNINHCELEYQYNLNKATSQLGISKFELRLLNFFNNFCLCKFSKPAHSMWNRNVPPIFFQSDLIRNSIYAYSSLNLFNLCDDFEELRIQDDLNSEIKSCDTIGSISFSATNKRQVEVSNDLHIKTTNYFIKTISRKNQLIERFYDPNDTTDKSIIATELMVSSFVIFPFLAMHHHKLMTLVSFDRSESDFISICQGIRNIMTSFGPHSPFNNIFASELKLKIPSVKQSSIPIIVKLREDLEFEYDHKDLYLISIDKYNILYQMLESLQKSLHIFILIGNPVPLYRWILSITDRYLDLVYEKFPFALRFLYIYSSLATLSKFQLVNDSNLWVDYMKWYKKYNSHLFGGWNYSMDESFYSLVFDKGFSLVGNSEANLITFDPDFLVQIV